MVTSTSLRCLACQIVFVLVCGGASSAIAQEDEFDPFKFWPDYGSRDLVTAESLAKQGAYDAAFEQYDVAFQKAAKFIQPFQTKPIKVGDTVINVPYYPDTVAPKTNVAVAATKTALASPHPERSVAWWNRIVATDQYEEVVVCGAPMRRPHVLLRDHLHYIDDVLRSPRRDSCGFVSELGRALGRHEGQKLQTILADHRASRTERNLFRILLMVLVALMGVGGYLLVRPRWPRWTPMFASFVKHDYQIDRRPGRWWFAAIGIPFAYLLFIPFGIVMKTKVDFDLFDLVPAFVFLAIPTYLIFRTLSEVSDRLSPKQRTVTTVGPGESPATAWDTLQLCDERRYPLSLRFGFPTEPFERPQGEMKPDPRWNVFQGVAMAVWLSEACLHHKTTLPDLFDSYFVRAARRAPAGWRLLFRRYLDNLEPARAKRLLDRLPTQLTYFVTREGGFEPVVESLERMDLDFHMITSIAWPLDEWTALFDRDELASVTESVVWRAEGPSWTQLFRRDADGSFLDAIGDPITLPNDATWISIPHAVKLGDAVKATWSLHFAEFELQSWLDQIGAVDRVLGVDEFEHDVWDAVEQVSFVRDVEFVFGATRITTFDWPAAPIDLSTSIEGMFSFLDFTPVIDHEIHRYLENVRHGQTPYTVFFDAVANSRDVMNQIWKSHDHD